MTERDWEVAAAKRLENTVGNVVDQLRRLADRIEQEAEHTIKDAAARSTQYASYGRVAERVVHEVTWGVANLNLANVIDAASDAAAAQAEKAYVAAVNKTSGSKLTAWGALQTMLGVADGWAQTAHENDQAMERLDVKDPAEQPFYVADIRTMLNDAAREMGLAPVWTEDQKV